MTYDEAIARAKTGAKIALPRWDHGVCVTWDAKAAALVVLRPVPRSTEPEPFTPDKVHQMVTNWLVIQ